MGFLGEFLGFTFQLHLKICDKIEQILKMKKNVSVYQPSKEHIYDWCGNQLFPEARDYITVNNIVRIQISYGKMGGEAIYVEIISIDENDIFTAIVLDTYRQFFEGEIIYVENGEIIHFSRNCVIEIPHIWEGNENLIFTKNMTTELCRQITGYIQE